MVCYDTGQDGRALTSASTPCTHSTADRLDKGTEYKGGTAFCNKSGTLIDIRGEATLWDGDDIAKGPKHTRFAFIRAQHWDALFDHRES